MELNLILFFLIIAVLIILFAKLYSDWKIAVLAGFLLMFLGVNILGYGYDLVYKTDSIGNFTYSNTSGANLLSSATFSDASTTRKVWDWSSLAFGSAVLVAGIIISYMSAIPQKPNRNGG